MVRTAECHQLESNFLRPKDGEEPGQTRGQTPAFKQKAAGLVSMFGPDEGGTLIHGLLMVQRVTRKPGELPKSVVQEEGSESVSYPATCSSQYCSDVRMETMRMRFDGLVMAGTFPEVIEIPEG